MAEGQQAVIQACEHAVKAQLGEMIYAADRGTNTFASVWDGSPNLLSFEASARDQLERVPNVISVDRFTASLQENTLTYQATIRTSFGESALQSDLTAGLIGG